MNDAELQAAHAVACEEMSEALVRFSARLGKHVELPFLWLQVCRETMAAMAEGMAMRLSKDPADQEEFRRLCAQPEALAYQARMDEALKLERLGEGRR